MLEISAQIPLIWADNSAQNQRSVLPGHTPFGQAYVPSSRVFPGLTRIDGEPTDACTLYETRGRNRPSKPHLFNPLIPNRYNVPMFYF